MTQVGKNVPAVQETPVQLQGWEDPLEKGMATHSSILAMRIPWTEDASASAKSFQSFLTLWDPINGSPSGYPIPGILQARMLDWVDRRYWWAIVHEFTKSWT